MTVYTSVPATSANMGPGFDCVGVALGLYNRTWVEAGGDGPRLSIERRVKGGAAFPDGEDNLIYRTIKDFYAGMGLPLPSLRIIQEDSVPAARGLGSSSACLAAGLLAANALSGAGRSRDELLREAARIEGHPDNAAPAFLGGVVVGAMEEGELTYKKLETPGLERLRFAAAIPDFPLETDKARKILPERITLADGVYNASRAALLVAALVGGDFGLLGAAMRDRFHQQYRQRLIPGMGEVFAACGESGAKAVYLSGAGPTIIAVVDERDGEFAPELPDGWEIQRLEADFKGAEAEVIIP